MREIKFRVWDGYQMSIVGPPGWIDDVYYGIAEYRQGYDSFTWMQYTGLKDKNGTDIYEGDVILTPDCFADRMVVAFKRACFRLQAPNGSTGKTLDEYYSQEDPGYSPRAWTVIGNIYEHSYLLEAQEA